MTDYASAAMDVSDGLFADCAHMASASALDLTIDLDQVPLSQALAHLKIKSPEDFARCLNGGDDYEILMAVPEDVSGTFCRVAHLAGCPVTQIGHARAVEGEFGLKKPGNLSTTVALRASVTFSYCKGQVPEFTRPDPSPECLLPMVLRLRSAWP